MTRRIALITTLLALALATPAAAQQNPFGPLPQAAPTDTPTATPVSTKSEDNNTARNTLFIIGGALVIGFALMGWFIMRDARHSIPEEDLAAMNRLREQGPHAHKQHAKAKARAKGRQQRQARKANRPR
jgi:phosphate-selective porin